VSPKIIENGTNQKRGTVSHLHSVATIAVSLVISECIRRQKNGRASEFSVWGRSRSLKMALFDSHKRLSIGWCL